MGGRDLNDSDFKVVSSDEEGHETDGDDRETKEHKGTKSSLLNSRIPIIISVPCNEDHAITDMNREGYPDKKPRFGICSFKASRVIYMMALFIFLLYVSNMAYTIVGIYKSTKMSFSPDLLSMCDFCSSNNIPIEFKGKVSSSSFLDIRFKNLSIEVVLPFISAKQSCVLINFRNWTFYGSDKPNNLDLKFNFTIAENEYNRQGCIFDDMPVICQLKIHYEWDLKHIWIPYFLSGTFVKDFRTIDFKQDSGVSEGDEINRLYQSEISENGTDVLEPKYNVNSVFPLENYEVSVEKDYASVVFVLNYIRKYPFIVATIPNIRLFLGTVQSKSVHSHNFNKLLSFGIESCQLSNDDRKLDLGNLKLKLSFLLKKGNIVNVVRSIQKLLRSETETFMIGSDNRHESDGGCFINEWIRSVGGFIFSFKPDTVNLKRIFNRIFARNQEGKISIYLKGFDNKNLVVKNNLKSNLQYYFDVSVENMSSFYMEALKKIFGKLEIYFFVNYKSNSSTDKREVLSVSITLEDTFKFCIQFIENRRFISNIFKYLKDPGIFGFSLSHHSYNFGNVLRDEIQSIGFAVNNNEYMISSFLSNFSMILLLEEPFPVKLLVMEQEVELFDLESMLSSSARKGRKESLLDVQFSNNEHELDIVVKFMFEYYFDNFSLGDIEIFWDDTNLHVLNYYEELGNMNVKTASSDEMIHWNYLLVMINKGSILIGNSFYTNMKAVFRVGSAYKLEIIEDYQIYNYTYKINSIVKIMCKLFLQNKLVKFLLFLQNSGGSFNCQFDISKKISEGLEEYEYAKMLKEVKLDNISTDELSFKVTCFNNFKDNLFENMKFNMKLPEFSLYNSIIARTKFTILNSLKWNMGFSDIFFDTNMNEFSFDVRIKLGWMPDVYKGNVFEYNYNQLQSDNAMDKLSLILCNFIREVYSNGNKKPLLHETVVADGMDGELIQFKFGAKSMLNIIEFFVSLCIPKFCTENLKDNNLLLFSWERIFVNLLVDNHPIFHFAMDGGQVCFFSGNRTMKGGVYRISDIMVKLSVLDVELFESALFLNRNKKFNVEVSYGRDHTGVEEVSGIFIHMLRYFIKELMTQDSNGRGGSDAELFMIKPSRLYENQAVFDSGKPEVIKDIVFPRSLPQFKPLSELDLSGSSLMNRTPTDVPRVYIDIDFKYIKSYLKKLHSKIQPHIFTATRGIQMQFDLRENVELDMLIDGVEVFRINIYSTTVDLSSLDAEDSGNTCLTIELKLTEKKDILGYFMSQFDVLSNFPESNIMFRHKKAMISENVIKNFVKYSGKDIDFNREPFSLKFSNEFIENTASNKDSWIMSRFISMFMPRKECSLNNIPMSKPKNTDGYFRAKTSVADHISRRRLVLRFPIEMKFPVPFLVSFGYDETTKKGLNVELFKDGVSVVNVYTTTRNIKSTSGVDLFLEVCVPDDRSSDIIFDLMVKRTLVRSYYVDLILSFGNSLDIRCFLTFVDKIGESTFVQFVGLNLSKFLSFTPAVWMEYSNTIPSLIFRYYYFDARLDVEDTNYYHNSALNYLNGIQACKNLKKPHNGDSYSKYLEKLERCRELLPKYPFYNTTRHMNIFKHPRQREISDSRQIVGLVPDIDENCGCTHLITKQRDISTFNSISDSSVQNYVKCIYNSKHIGKCSFVEVYPPTNSNTRNSTKITMPVYSDSSTYLSLTNMLSGPKCSVTSGKFLLGLSRPDSKNSSEIFLALVKFNAIMEMRVDKCNVEKYDPCNRRYECIPKDLKYMVPFYSEERSLFYADSSNEYDFSGKKRVVSYVEVPLYTNFNIHFNVVPLRQDINIKLSLTSKSQNVFSFVFTNDHVDLYLNSKLLRQFREKFVNCNGIPENFVGDYPINVCLRYTPSTNVMLIKLTHMFTNSTVYMNTKIDLIREMNSNYSSISISNPNEGCSIRDFGYNINVPSLANTSILSVSNKRKPAGEDHLYFIEVRDSCGNILGYPTENFSWEIHISTHTVSNEVVKPSHKIFGISIGEDGASHESAVIHPEPCNPSSGNVFKSINYNGLIPFKFQPKYSGIYNVTLCYYPKVGNVEDERLISTKHKSDILEYMNRIIYTHSRVCSRHYYVYVE